MLLRYLVWLAVPLLALIELVAHAYHGTRVPEPEEYRRLLPAAVSELRKENELVVAAPYWSEPSVRFALGDRVMPLKDVARPDERSYQRAIEVSVSGEHAPELLGWRSLDERKVGPFRLRLLQNPEASAPLFDFVDNLNPEHATASAKKRTEYRDCGWNPRARVSNGALDSGHATFPRERFDCGGADWNFVGVTVIEDERYRPRRCIWAQPSDSGATRVTYSDVPLGKVIRGHAGLPYWVERWKKGEPITIRVQVGDQVVGEMEHADGEGWKAFEVSTERFVGQRASVQFEVTAARDAQRQLCFHAEAL